MPAAEFVPRQPAHITPIRCEKCNGKAPLMRRTVADGGAARSPTRELWTYECLDCGHQMTRDME